MNKEIITQSYVSNESETHVLQYCLFQEINDRTGENTYGISIVHRDDRRMREQKSAVISADRQEVIDLIHLYAQNFVFPYTLPELIEDRGR